jgi:CYTH domain-containing protein
MIEIERTFLAKHIPEGIKDGKEILDIAIPSTARHPNLRIRKYGNKIEITKKEMVNKGDASVHKELTIPLTEEEYKEFSQLEGKRMRKIRYKYDHDGNTAEVDVYQDKLKGLVVIDFEFETTEEKDNFEMPDFCLKDVTQEEVIAGGLLVGKSYEDIEEKLTEFGYKKI